MRMNKVRPTMLGSLIKHRAYLTYIKYYKNVNNNNNSSINNNNNNNNNKREEEVNESFEMED